MKRRVLLIVTFMLTMIVSAAIAGNGGSTLPLVIKPTNPGGIQIPPSKSPILVPEVYLDGNTLSFDSTIEGCTVQLLDEDETVVYSSVISIGQTTLVLPTTLSGEFELQIVSGDITFYCDIEL